MPRTVPVTVPKEPCPPATLEKLAVLKLPTAIESVPKLPSEPVIVPVLSTPKTDPLPAMPNEVPVTELN